MSTSEICNHDAVVENKFSLKYVRFNNQVYRYNEILYLASIIHKFTQSFDVLMRYVNIYYKMPRARVYILTEITKIHIFLRSKYQICTFEMHLFKQILATVKLHIDS